MHSLVRRLLEPRSRPYSLARFRLDDGALLALFEPAGLAWIAKTARTPAGIRRLRAEALALEELNAAAAELGVPRLVAWSAGEADDQGSACLVQTGLAGRPVRDGWRWKPSAPWAALSPYTQSAAAWLQRLQRQVTQPNSVALADVFGMTIQMAEHIAAQDHAAATLLRVLLPHVRPCRDFSLPPAVAVHGDFWSGNALFAARARHPLWPGSKPAQPLPIQVVDWSGFSAGTALDDLLTWMSHLELAPQPGFDPDLQRWIAVFFIPGSVREFLRNWSQTVGYSERASRLSFYFYLLRRMLWELGFGLQTRSRRERDEAGRRWSQRLSWLATHRYPDPFTPMPITVQPSARSISGGS